MEFWMWNNLLGSFLFAACATGLLGCWCAAAFGQSMGEASASATSPSSDWYERDALARELSQLTGGEYQRIRDTPGLAVQPIAVPREEKVVTGNDYLMWPIATRIGDTTIVLFARKRYHFGRNRLKDAREDEHSGIRMITRSSDGGRTWTEPMDLFDQVGRWDRTLFGGWGGGLGVHDGVVYLALNEGLYRSHDKGATWSLVTAEPDFGDVPLDAVPVTFTEGEKFQATAAPPVDAPLWSPGMRITFDDERGLILWSTRGFKSQGRDGSVASHYGKYLVALYSPDFGETWHYEEQKLPEGIYLNEITPVSFDNGKLAFFLRQGGHDQHFAQGYSETGWFPFDFATTSVGPTKVMDTPDVIFNPRNGRLEAVAPFRFLDQPMEMRLYSIAAEALARGESEWRYDGTLARYEERFSRSDGFNPVGGVVDPEAGLHRFHVWGGDVRNRAAIFEYRRTLDTSALQEALLNTREAAAARSQ